MQVCHFDEQVFEALNLERAGEYKVVKVAILRWYDISKKTYYLEIQGNQVKVWGLQWICNQAWDLFAK